MDVDVDALGVRVAGGARTARRACDQVAVDSPEVDSPAVQRYNGLVIEDFGTEPLSGRRLLLVEADCAADVPATFSIAGSNFACLLAMDATELSDAEVYEVASRLLEAGCVYVCCWGPQCERVHDIFDVAAVDSAPDGPTAMTTWHADESLAEATWYLLVNTIPVHEYTAGCRTTVAIAIGSRDWASEIRAAFVAPSAFCARVVRDD